MSGKKSKTNITIIIASDSYRDITTFLHFSRSFSYDLTKHALRGPSYRDMALLPNPGAIRGISLTTVRYKKLGAFIHFFTCMHFGKRDDEQ